MEIELKKIKDIIEEQEKVQLKLFKLFDSYVEQVLNLVKFVKFLRQPYFNQQCLSFQLKKMRMQV
ncbi:unnamed protein product [Paramecium octaurelia]|uniref:Uncharacterized protein n=1 Tax=Paramecium octaurelia TaxID=43137 RepID=A0A8S1VR79_PAROT|nr:unnamed protein product [Paramecium octaurelia]